jgi:hypothetical protein
MSISDIQIKLNNIATYCFRDIADNDYISARVLFRYELIHQAYWCSLQSIEKYLKAILLFNGKSVKNISHDIEEPIKTIKAISEIEFYLPKDVISFLRILNNEGNNRYFEYPYAFENLSLFKLDKTVWHIRRYCFCLTGSTTVDDEDVDLLPFNLAKVQDKIYIKYPHKYELVHGELEKILNERKSIKRKQLIWKNIYYGQRRKGTIKVNRNSWVAGNPPHFLEENIFNDVSGYIKFSKPVIEYFSNKYKKHKK